jgi:Tfp pilus assembly ATPase PilU
LLSGEKITFITSTFPTIKGERISIKLYKPPKTLKELAINEDDRIFIENSLKNQGIILISGPSLSGKSFVGYSLLNSFRQNSSENIMTVEAIVKYDLIGIHQCELKEKIGFNFEKAAKFIDFQSPDIIYAEEVFLEQDIKYLSLFAEAEKTVITEISADNTEILQEKLDSEKYREYKKNINCLIFVANIDKIQIIKPVKQE